MPAPQDPRFPPGHPRNREGYEVDIPSESIKMAQIRLDQFASQRGYDGILSACTYVTSAVPQFALEAQNCVQVRDAVWSKLYQIQAEVANNIRPAPTTVQAVMAELDVLFVWTV